MNYEKKLKMLLVGLSVTGVLLYAGIIHYALLPKQPKIKGADIAPNEMVVDGKKILVVNTDKDISNETFLVKSDKDEYSGMGTSTDNLSTTVFFSVENTRAQENGYIRFVFNHGERLTFIQKYSTSSSIQDVVETVKTEVTCPPNQPATRCYDFVKQDSQKEEVITDNWTDVPLLGFVPVNSTLKKPTIGVSNKNGSIAFPSGVTFYRANISYKMPKTPQEFYVEVIGQSNGYGVLDPTINTKLLGDDTSSNDSSASPGYLCLGKFTAIASGNMNIIKYMADGATNFQVALYADNSGSPGSLLGYSMGLNVPSGNTYYNRNFATTTIVSGTTYWIGFINQSASTVMATTGGTSLYKALAYGSSFPDPAGGGYASAGWSMHISGYDIETTADVSTSTPRQQQLFIFDN